MSPSRVDTLPDGLNARLQQRGALQVGDVVGERYQLTRLLGDGAMGQVFVARSLAIGVEVAVKVLRHDLSANSEFRRRFQVEAQAIAAVDHPHVARFVDLVIGDPTLLVMEYVRGDSLAEVLHRQRRMGPRRAVRIATRLCWGLDAVHEAGIIHRDLKPGNIMLAPSREVSEVPKIIDFGLAKLAHLSSVDAPLTRAGQIVGTPEFMAPEQIAGKEVDARADVYALGCVLYTMLVGRSPFGGSDDDVQTLYRQLNEQPAPAASLAPGLSDALDAVVQRALAKDPSARFQSMQELARALDDTPEAMEPRRTGVAVGTAAMPATSEAPRARGGWRSRPVLALALAAAAVTGVVVGALVFGGGGRAARGAATGAGAPPLLMLTTTPPGATVEVDGKVMPETTPTALRDLTPGAHEVTVRLDGHEPFTRHLDLAAGERLSLQLALPARSRTVMVKTVPAGARVYVDDMLFDSTTPTTLSLQTDEFYQLRVEKGGFQPVTRNLAPEDTTDELTLTMEEDKEPVGNIMVVSPSKAEVWIDGVDTGYTTPTVGMRVPAGEHTVEIRDSTGQRAAARVKVVAGMTEQVQLNLQPECR